MELSNIKRIFEEYGEKAHYEAGRRIMVKGTPAEQVWYICSGTTRAYHTNLEGDEITLFFVSAENIIGLESIVAGNTYLNECDAVTAMDVLILRSSRFMQLWYEKRYPMEELYERFIKRFILLQDHICCTHYRDGNQKVAYLLYSQCMQSGVNIPYSQDQIAVITGINRVSVNRILNYFAKEGIISLGYRKIRVIDPERLVKLFNSVGYFVP